MSQGLNSEIVTSAIYQRKSYCKKMRKITEFIVIIFHTQEYCQTNSILIHLVKSEPNSFSVTIGNPRFAP